MNNNIGFKDKTIKVVDDILNTITTVLDAGKGVIRTVEKGVTVMKNGAEITENGGKIALGLIIQIIVIPIILILVALIIWFPKIYYTCVKNIGLRIFITILLKF